AGNTYSYVDEEMRNRLQVRLITRTLAFHVG
ncbi:helix-turn-helix domain-containing protein, partial [Agathobacter rectalis]